MRHVRRRPCLLATRLLQAGAARSQAAHAASKRRTTAPSSCVVITRPVTLRHRKRHAGSKRRGRTTAGGYLRPLEQSQMGVGRRVMTVLMPGLRPPLPVLQHALSVSFSSVRDQTVTKRLRSGENDADQAQKS